MQTLGQKFRAAREAKGLTIEEIASNTRINAGYLRSLEADDRDAFPGAFFYRSFIRQYAQILELPEGSYQRELEDSLADQEKMLQELPSQFPARRLDLPPIPTGSGWNVEETKRWAMRVASLALVLLLCTGLYQLYDRFQRPAPESASAVRESETTPVETQPAKKEPEPKKLVTPKPAAPESAAAAAAPPPAGVTETRVEQAASPVQEPPAVIPAPDPGAASTIRVRLTARELCWVDSWRGTEHYYSSALQPGQSQVLTGNPGMRVLVGNAGGVDIEFNGRVIPPAGPRGQVRTLEFGEGTYRVVASPRADAPPQPQTQN